MSLKGGTVCAVRGCCSRTASKNIILFRFPRDPSKGKAWLEACNRLDLIQKSPLQLYNNYKICALHFEARMFSSPEQNRLLPMALPTIFPGNEIFGWEDKLSEPIIILSARESIIEDFLSPNMKNLEKDIKFGFINGALTENLA